MISAMKPLDMVNITFIIGSPRSGTSILSEIVCTHPAISERYEPYFVWDRRFRNAPDDQRSEQDCTPGVCREIYNDFLYFIKEASI